MIRQYSRWPRRMDSAEFFRLYQSLKSMGFSWVDQILCPMPD